LIEVLFSEDMFDKEIERCIQGCHTHTKVPDSNPEGIKSRLCCVDISTLSPGCPAPPLRTRE
jgi:hypothetical protein